MKAESGALVVTREQAWLAGIDPGADLGSDLHNAA
jgi:hypothetical protein